jgi:hypothetical protein
MPTVHNLTILGVDVNATSRRWGSGIGTWFAFNGKASNFGHLTIAHGRIAARCTQLLRNRD